MQCCRSRRSRHHNNQHHSTAHRRRRRGRYRRCLHRLHRRHRGSLCTYTHVIAFRHRFRGDHQ